MVIVADDIKFYLSGGEDNALPAASLGGARSNTEYTDPILMLFDRVEAQEAVDGDIEYRCVYIRNENATNIYEDLVMWILQQTPSEDTSIAIGLDPSGINGSAGSIANEGVPPAGVIFTRPLAVGEGIEVGNIPVNGSTAIWIRRTVSAAAAVQADNYRIGFEGETDP